jgi:hypothetical protein
LPCSVDKIDTDAFLVLNIEGSDRVSLFYLTGFTGEGALLVTREEAFLVTSPGSPVKGLSSSHARRRSS